MILLGVVCRDFRQDCVDKTDHDLDCPYSRHNPVQNMALFLTMTAVSGF